MVGLSDWIGEVDRARRSSLWVSHFTVAHRNYLYIDVDLDRFDVDGTSLSTDYCSTSVEKADARMLIDSVWEHLTVRGWPEPALIGSGNGWALLYKIDLPASDDDTISRCLRQWEHSLR